MSRANDETLEHKIYKQNAKKADCHNLTTEKNQLSLLCYQKF